MIKYFVAVAFLVLPNTQALAGDVTNANFRPKMNLSFNTSVEPKFQKVLDGILNPAFQLVMATGHPEVTITPTNKPDADFIVLFTDRDSANDLFKVLPGISAFIRGLKGDAFTFKPPEDPTGPAYVIVLVDEAMYEVKEGHRFERPMGFSRLVTLLGHEIYGNVVNFKKHEKTLSSPQFMHSSEFRQQEWLRSEVRAFTASVQFLESLISKFKNMLPASSLKGFEKALVRERDLLKMYQVRAEVDLGVGTISSLPVRCELIFR